MIANHKLDSLTEDELCVLLFVINNTDRQFEKTELCWLNPKWVYIKLNEAANKIKPEHKPMLQSIVDKLIN
ncbi:MAG: hypothetical protein EBU90_28485 [Proteobacteria bacterium]|nr:hypothetical protein [Pseudomonadota bacterium]